MSENETFTVDVDLWGLSQMDEHLEREGETFEVLEATIEGEPGNERLEATIEVSDR